MTPDGRKGKVFCLRLTDAERELITKALDKERERRKRAGVGYWWAPVAVGDFIRAAAVDRAKRLLDPASPASGNTASSAETKKRKRSRR
jgi:hypothetical protein